MAHTYYTTAKVEQRKPFEVIQREAQEFLSSAAHLRHKLEGRRILGVS